MAIDGIDATGKGTQIRNLKQRNDNIFVIDEFSNSEIGELISSNVARNQFFSLRKPGQTVKAETALFIADALFKSEYELEQAKETSKLAISDRGLLSIIAYQAIRLSNGGMPRSEAIEWSENLVDAAFVHAQKPDINVLLIAPMDEVVRRCVQRGDKINSEDYKFLSETQDLLMQLAERPKNKTHIINVTGLSIDDLSNNIEGIIYSSYETVIQAELKPPRPNL